MKRKLENESITQVDKKSKPSPSNIVSIILDDNFASKFLQNKMRLTQNKVNQREIRKIVRRIIEHDDEDDDEEDEEFEEEFEEEFDDHNPQNYFARKGIDLIQWRRFIMEDVVSTVDDDTLLGNAFTYGAWFGLWNYLPYVERMIEETIGKSIDYDPLCYASHEIQNNKKIVRNVVELSRKSFCYASDELKADREFMMEIVKIAGTCIKRASPELKLDRELVLEAVKNNGKALKYVPEEMQNDKEIAMEADKQNGEEIDSAEDESKEESETE